MPNIPFTAYDVFAYLSSGFVVIAAADFAFDGDWILNAELSVIEGLVWIVIAYVLGHAVSAVSSPILEQWFAERALGYRHDVLFGGSSGAFWRGKLFPGYLKPLPTELRTRVLEQATKEAKIGVAGPALFLYCDAVVRQKPEAAPTLATFLTVYSFARNACFASAVAAALLVSGALADRTNADTKVLLALAAIAAAVALLYRYLKFFRLYAREVFLFYAARAESTTG